MVSLYYAAKRVLDCTIVTEDNKVLAETRIRENIEKKFSEMGLERVPEFYLDLLVLQKMKEVFEEEKESKLVLQRNLTMKEKKFLSDEGIKVYFGDFEVSDEEMIISDFEDKVYLLDYDLEKAFIYAHAFRFTLESSDENSFVS